LPSSVQRAQDIERKLAKAREREKQKDAQLLEQDAVIHKIKYVAHKHKTEHEEAQREINKLRQRLEVINRTHAAGGFSPAAALQGLWAGTGGVGNVEADAEMRFRYSQTPASLTTASFNKVLAVSTPAPYSLTSSRNLHEPAPSPSPSRAASRPTTAGTRFGLGRIKGKHDHSDNASDGGQSGGGKVIFAGGARKSTEAGSKSQ
jgi:hypothetical protein